MMEYLLKDFGMGVTLTAGLVVVLSLIGGVICVIERDKRWLIVPLCVAVWLAGWIWNGGPLRSHRAEMDARRLVIDAREYYSDTWYRSRPHHRQWPARQSVKMVKTKMTDGEFLAVQYEGVKSMTAEKMAHSWKNVVYVHDCAGIWDRACVVDVLLEPTGG